MHDLRVATGRRLILCLAVGLASCTSSGVGDRWDFEHERARESDAHRYVVDIGRPDGLGSADVVIDNGSPITAGDLVFDVIGTRVLVHFQGLRDLGEQYGVLGFSLPLRGERSADGTFEIAGHSDADNGRSSGQIGDDAIIGEIGGGILKNGYSIEFTAPRVEPIDGTHPCRGYRCTDHCDQDNPCETDESCTSATTALPQSCVPVMGEPELDPWFVVLVSNPRHCQSRLVDGLPAPGVEIASIRLRDSDGEVVGWAQSVSAQPGTSPNAFGYAGVFNGEAVPVPTCENPTYSLGCEGAYLAVGFDGDHRYPLALNAAAELEIDVLDCGAGDDRQTFDVLACTGRAVRSHDLASCSVVLGTNIEGSARLPIP